jgi:hypothetical protein
MVEADSHLKLISTSTLHISKEFEHIDICCALAYSKSLTQLYQAEGHLKLLPPSTLDIYKVFEHIDMLCSGIQ